MQRLPNGRFQTDSGQVTLVIKGREPHRRIPGMLTILKQRENPAVHGSEDVTTNCCDVPVMLTGGGNPHVVDEY
jgi:hypothetical protein